MVDRAADALRADPVYLDPAAEAVTPDEAQQLRDRIETSGAAPMYIAVFPAGGAGEETDPVVVLRRLHAQVGREGVYAVVVGRRFRAGDTGTLRPESAAQLADDAFQARRDEGAAAILADFVDRVGRARGGGAAANGREDGSGDGGYGALGVFALLAAGAGGYYVYRRRRQQRDEFDDVRQTANEDLIALAEDIRALDLDVEMPNADPAAKEDYARAVECYQRADRAFDTARVPEDLEEVSAALEEGRFAMAAAKARLEGREPPERRPPCFFDPRHGPSVRDVEWAPDGGTPRLVPACAADAQAVEDGYEPAAREVLVGGQRMPYWNAPPVYGPWAGGFFGGMTGGLLPGLLIGSMLGSGLGFGFPGVAHAESGSYDEGGGFGDFGGGDFGGGGDGGDFADGDFGDFGGDFGGGDIGGGDIGGGDF